MTTLLPQISFNQVYFYLFFQNLLSDDKVVNVSGSETVCNKLKSSFASLDEKAISPTPIKTVGSFSDLKILEDSML